MVIESQHVLREAFRWTNKARSRSWSTPWVAADPRSARKGIACEAGRGKGLPRSRDRHRGEKHCFERAQKDVRPGLFRVAGCGAGKCRLRGPEDASREGTRLKSNVPHSISAKRGILREMVLVTFDISKVTRPEGDVHGCTSVAGGRMPGATPGTRNIIVTAGGGALSRLDPGFSRKLLLHFRDFRHPWRSRRNDGV